MIKNVKNERSVSETVNEILTNKPFIQDLFRIDAVNYSGLARHLVPEVKKRLGKDEINIESVIVAVKRFGDHVNGVEFSEEVRRVIAGCTLFARNDLLGLTLRKSKTIYNNILELQNTVDSVGGEILYVLQSASVIEVITERKIVKELLKKNDDSDILHKSPALALIGVNKFESASEVPGVILCLSGVLTMHGITLIDVTSTYTELTFFVHEEDAAKAYTLLDKEIKKYKY